MNAATSIKLNVLIEESCPKVNLSNSLSNELIVKEFTEFTNFSYPIPFIITVEHNLLQLYRSHCILSADLMNNPNSYLYLWNLFLSN
ncbi:hypothetical protein BpHYR1_052516 [Brachionus plicatilis]|uniref:Uncharacterized protein n=1 Tax=Brachionus plicatilis TaxID=10195 RepID=A0A3M7QSS1_BRAPC|nr:hypothetical protein BpHYR1_052516 [Brachionus plicatilis]